MATLGSWAFIAAGALQQGNGHPPQWTAEIDLHAQRILRLESCREL
jgi:hypothetical protein